MDQVRGIDPRPTLVYCRESRDENSAHFERIETQRDILLAFCQRRGLVNIVEVILDDDRTGTDFRRFDGVLDRVRRGEIQVIVFKDSSRLGRNLKESLIFTERVERWGAELLFESEEYNEDFFPLKAWFNEQRAKEDSQKIRRVLRHKMETGDLLVKPAYGYRRGPAGELLPRPDTAEIVRWLFEETVRGRGTGELAQALNARGVPTPSQAAGGQRVTSRWNSQHIRRILGDPVYLGTMTHHRTSQKSFKDKRTVAHPPEEWIVLEDHHEPLVTQELFRQVQSARGQYKGRSGPGERHPFSGLLCCGRCGSPLVFRRRQGRPDAYLCGKNHREGACKSGTELDLGCTPHRVRADTLSRAALQFMECLLQQADLDREALVRRTFQANVGYDRVGAWERELEQCRRSMDQLYEDKLSGLIGPDFFARKYRDLAQREADLKERLCRAPSPAPQDSRRLTDLPMGDIISCLNHETVTGETLRLLFERILVYEPGELDRETGEALGLSAPDCQQIADRGGLVFLTRMAP